MLQRLLRAVLQRYAATHQPTKTLYGEDGTPYLSRWTLREWGPWRLRLHRIYRSDADKELHSHPWEEACSLILVAGYREERRVPAPVGSTFVPWMVKVRQVRPWSFNILRADTYHRVDLLDGECWTLIVTGPKTKTWWFWNRLTNVTTEWDVFTYGTGRVAA